MYKIINKIIRKDLSRAKYFNGVNFIEYYEKVFKVHNKKFNISQQILKRILDGDNFIKKDNFTISLKVEYFKTNEYLENEEDLYNYSYIKNLYKEEINTNILLVYKLIIDHDALSYYDIEKMLNKIDSSLKIDKKLTSHYCKELKKINLIYKINNNSKNNERLVKKILLKNLYNKDLPCTIENGSNDEDSIPDISKEIYINNREFNSNDFYKFSLDPRKILEINEGEKSYLVNNVQVSKCYIENRFCFLVDECILDNNILFHLQLNNEKGLTTNQIGILIGFLGREKAIVRILGNLEKKGCIKHISKRKGKKFEFVYMIKEGYEIPDHILYLVDYYLNKFDNKINCFTEKPNFETEIKIENNNLEYNNIKLEEPESTGKYHFNLNLQNYIKLNNHDYLFIINQILSDEKFIQIKLKYHIENSIQSQNLSDSTKLNIILDFFYSNLDLIKVRILDDVSFNRYLFCLNKIYLHKILSANDLKIYIKNELEAEIGFTIDRRTLKNTIKNLETLGFIKTMEFEMIMRNTIQLYENNKGEIIQQKLVTLRRDVTLTDEIMKDVEESLKPRQKSCNTSHLMIKKIEEEEYVTDSCKQDLDFLSKFDLSINNNEKNVIDFVDLFYKLQEKRLGNIFKHFILSWKRFYFMKNNLTTLFNKKSKRVREMSSLVFYKVLEANCSNKVIIPRYMIKKIGENSKDETKDDRDIANLISLKYDDEAIDFNKTLDMILNIKNYIPESNLSLTSYEEEFAKKYFIPSPDFKNNNLLNEYLSIKRKRTEEVIENREPINRKLKKMHESEYKSSIDFSPIISKIYLNPKITVKKLRNSLFNYLPCEMVHSDFLLYLNRIGILKISKMNNIDYSKNYLRLDNEMNLEFDEAVDRFLNI